MTSALMLQNGGMSSMLVIGPTYASHRLSFYMMQDKATIGSADSTLPRFSTSPNSFEILQTSGGPSGHQGPCPE